MLYFNLFNPARPAPLKFVLLSAIKHGSNVGNCILRTSPLLSSPLLSSSLFSLPLHKLLTDLPSYCLTYYLPASLPTALPFYPPTYLSYLSYLPAYLPTYPRTYLPHLLTY